MSTTEATTWRASTGRHSVPLPSIPKPVIMPLPPLYLLPNPPVILALPLPGMFFLATPPPTPIAPTASTASEAKKPQEPKKCKPAPPPPSQTPGMRYIYPKEHTCLHVIEDTKVWEGTDGDFVCKVFNVGTKMTVGELIEVLLCQRGGAGEGAGAEGWAVTEVVEMGDGVFVKDVTVQYGSDDAGKSLAAMGWNQARGGARPPVWLVLHLASD